MRSELLRRVTSDPAIMGGRPCVGGTRVTVAAIMGMLAAGESEADILTAYPYLAVEDVRAALAFAAWKMQERDYPLAG